LPLFPLTEYAEAEARFISTALDALSRSRGGLAALIQREPASRVGTTQVTTDAGDTVEFTSVEITAPMRMDWDAIAAGDVGPLVVTLDEAAGKHHEQLTDFILSNLESLTAATGNQVDADGRPFFEALFEMFDKIDLTFEDDGSISSSFAWVMDPETLETLKRREAELTTEQRQKLDELVERKRQEYFATRRRRQLS
jgi:hypothetical protein